MAANETTLTETVETDGKLELEFTPEELKKLLAIAKRRGFTNATSYLKQLVDINAHNHEEDLVFMEDTPNEWILADFKEAMRDVIHGEFGGIPADEAFAELHAEFNDE